MKEFTMVLMAIIICAFMYIVFLRHCISVKEQELNMYKYRFENLKNINQELMNNGFKGRPKKRGYINQKNVSYVDFRSNNDDNT